MLSLALLTYGVVSVCFGLGEPDIHQSARFCVVWLCPEEFSGTRVVRLLQQSAVQSSGATAEIKRALILDPASAYAWADLGDALANTNDSPQARYSFERALAAGPRNPIILFRAANFFFRSGDSLRAMTTFAAILSNAQLTEYYAPAFLTYSRMGVPIEMILEKGIPPQRIPAQSFLRFLMDSHRLQETKAAWTWAAKRSLTDDRLTADYLAFLIREKQETRAAETWAEINGSAFPSYRRTNWLFNADFKRAPTPVSLDWYFEPNSDVQAEAENGALRLVFKGQENVDYHGVSQETVLHAGRWTIKGSIKTAAITTDQGVGLRVTGDGLDVRTAPITGTHAWTEARQTFEIKPQQSPLVRVEVERTASRRFDNKITGVAWLNQLELTPSR